MSTIDTTPQAMPNMVKNVRSLCAHRVRITSPMRSPKIIRGIGRLTPANVSLGSRPTPLPQSRYALAQHSVPQTLEVTEQDGVCSQERSALPIYSLGMTPSSRSISPWLLSNIAVLVIASSVGAPAQAAPRSRAAEVIDSMPYARLIDQAAISPNGTEVAVVVGGELTIRSTPGGAPRPIELESRLRLRDACWSADGKQIAFFADLPGEAPAAQVWTAAPDGTALVKRAEL